MMKKLVRISAQLALVVLLVACGEETAPTEVAPEAATLQKGPPAPPPTVIDVTDDAASDEVEPEFTILREALAVTGLDEALASRGQVTVFAPTDEAFGRLLELLGMTAEELLGEEDLLEEVLKYHVAPGRRTSADVLSSKQIRTFDGRFIYPFSNDDGAFIRDGSEDTSDATLIPDLLDIEASNGIIHGIDEVLLPGDGGQPGRKGQRPDKDDDGDDDDDETEFEGWASLVSVEGDAPERAMRIEVEYDDMTVEVVVSEAGTDFGDDGDITDFDGLLQALDAEDPMVQVEGEGELQDDGSVAADEIKAETGDRDDDEDGDDDEIDFGGYATLISQEGDAPTRSLRMDLEYEGETITVDVFEGETEFEDDGNLADFDALLEALQDDELLVVVKGEGDVREDGTVEADEITAWAKDLPIEEPDDGVTTLAEFVKSFATAPDEADREFTILYAALDKAGLLEALDDPEVQYTVLAPTDEAFTKLLGLLEISAEELLANPDLDQILLYHVLGGRKLSSEFMLPMEFTTVQGSTVRSIMSMTGIFLQDLDDRTEDAMLLAPDFVDLEVDNGVVHVIDEVLLFQ
jgi:uncharacterized surface protein with fasciclin (FAS1) repeats